MADVKLNAIRKVYPDGTEAVKDLTLDVADGALVVLVGPSGCGKSTALRMVAGLEDITDGEITIGGRVVNELAPRERDVAMIFQNYALYAHMNVYDNMAFPLKLRRVSKKQRDESVRQVARTLGLEHHLDRKPRALSGGQAQRVAIGRAIVRNPQAFLMDEPLSNLDAKLRVQMRAEILQLQKKLGVTTIYVTHDQVEALTMGDSVAVMRDGGLQQLADPQTLYDVPANLFVAGFVGSPPMNFIEGEVSKTDEGYSVRIGAKNVSVDAHESTSQPALERYVGRNLVVGVRPENLVEAPQSDGFLQERRLTGLPTLREALGSDVLVHFLVEGSQTMPRSLRKLAHELEDPASVEQLEQGRGTIFIGRFSPSVVIREDERFEVGLRAGSLRFFDPDTGQALTT
jgi:multiple sugar transport system ATP-binding protein